MLFLVLAILGYIAGMALESGENETPALVKQQTASIGESALPKSAPDRKDVINPKTYTAVAPTTGPLINTVSAKRMNNGLTLSINRKENPLCANVKPQQNIIFYNPSGAFLAAGKITNIQSDDNNDDIIVEYLYYTKDAVDIPAQDFASIADIIISETGPLKRIPLSAVVQEQGQSVVYIAKNQSAAADEGIITVAIESTPISTALKDNWFVEVGNTIRKSDLVIINPDDALNEETQTTIQKVDLAPPIPDNTTLWIDNAVAERTLSIEYSKKAGANCSIGSTETSQTETTQTEATDTETINTNDQPITPADPK